MVSSGILFPLGYVAPLTEMVALGSGFHLFCMFGLITQNGAFSLRSSQASFSAQGCQWGPHDRCRLRTIPWIHTVASTESPGLAALPPKPRQNTSGSEMWPALDA